MTLVSVVTLGKLEPKLKREANQKARSLLSLAQRLMKWIAWPIRRKGSIWIRERRKRKMMKK
jgi:hypothetical protein